MQNARVWKSEESSPVKRYLMEYRALIQRRDALLFELERLRSATQRATTSFSTIGHCGAPDTAARENAILRVVDGEAKLMEVIQHIGDALAVRLVLLERLDDERHKTLLTLRYINGLSWEQIGYDMHYERTQIFDIHNAALDAIKGIMAVL